jgi:selenide,water dikinase
MPQNSADIGGEPRLTSLAHGGGCGCKLAPNMLSDLLVGLGSAPVPPELLVDAATSDDAAVWRLPSGEAIVATTDFFMPIVDDPYEFGRIAATNALSDVYAMGARPIFALALLAMPVAKLSAATIRRVLEGGRDVAMSAGAPIAGGHSIDSVEPIYGLAAIGLVDPARILANSAARPGDLLILGKPLGIGIFSAALKRQELPLADYETMIASTTLLNTPGAGLSKIEGVSAATDVTGFGLLGHLIEMCRGSGVGARIARDAVPIFPGARRLAAEGVKTGASARNWMSVENAVVAPDAVNQSDRDLLCDPQTSGGLLVACSRGAADDVLALFRRHGHREAAVIGELTEGPAQIRLA